MVRVATCVYAARYVNNSDDGEVNQWLSFRLWMSLRQISRDSLI